MGRPHHAEPTSPAGTAVAQQAAVLASYARRLKRRGWRGLVWLNGAPEQARQQKEGCYVLVGRRHRLIATAARDHAIVEQPLHPSG